MKKLFKEPLVHFLVLGAGLFLIFEVVNKDAEVSEAVAQEGGSRYISKEITITAELIESLSARFAKTWQRAPTEKELNGLIDEYVKEEILYREALALELDRDDAVVRRRLRQKIEFFTQDVVDLVVPGEGDLSDYLTSNPDPFRLDPILTFKQVYLNAKDRAETLDADIESLLKQLRAEGADADIRKAGDRLMLEQGYASMPLREVERLFGREFRAGLNEVKPGDWQGPVRSGYGVHLVYIDKRIEGRLPALDEVRDQVLREVTALRRKQANDSIYEKWRAAYDVTIEELPPKPRPMVAQ